MLKHNGDGDAYELFVLIQSKLPGIKGLNESLGQLRMYVLSFSFSL
jgi:hypothetical protein